jgi:hypothetical protein
MNLGLPVKLNKARPSSIKVERPKAELLKRLDPNWLAGFIEGEACFYVKITKKNTFKTGQCVELNFILVQHIRDIHLMNSILNYFNCGKLYEKSIARYVVQKNNGY